MEACSLLVNLREGMQSSSEQLVGEERHVTTLITAAKETTIEEEIQECAKFGLQDKRRKGA